MAWDDEDDKGGKGPWGSRTPDKDKPQGPWEPPQPQASMSDLDDLLRQAHGKFGGLFGNQPSSQEGKKGVGILLLLALGFWLGTGFYRVQPGDNAVLLTFGKLTSTRAQPGLGYHIPWPVQTVQTVDVAFDRRVEIGGGPSSDQGSGRNAVNSSRMLTGDENIVDVDFVVMWRVGSAEQYLFRIRDPDRSVRKVAESAMREVIGQSDIQDVLTNGRADIEARTKILMQKMLDEYQSGVVVNSVQLLSVNPPPEVIDAFDDVQRARADMAREKNEGETYSNNILPVAQGQAQKIIQDAEAYKAATIAKAKGDAARFTSVYDAYRTAPSVTEKRIYIQTMEDIMKSGRKVLMSDGKGASIMPYMPLGALPQMMPAAGADTSSGQGAALSSGGGSQ